MYRENKIYKRGRKGLAGNQFGLVIKPQQSIRCIKTESELNYPKVDG